MLHRMQPVKITCVRRRIEGVCVSVAGYINEDLMCLSACLSVFPPTYYNLWDLGSACQSGVQGQTGTTTLLSTTIPLLFPGQSLYFQCTTQYVFGNDGSTVERGRKGGRGGRGEEVEEG